LPPTYDLPLCFLVTSEHLDHLVYRRARFAAVLPLGYRYTENHFWISVHEKETCRIGLTRFGARLLGEIVDFGFEVQIGKPLTRGKVIGWIEGFKTVTELVSLSEGAFAGANPALEQQVTLVNQDPQGAGWLYAIRGELPSGCLEAQGYARVLDAVIDRWLGEQTTL
jgi:glycine cleavage system H protein